MQRHVVVVATGGTIAGNAARPQDHVGYTAAALSIDTLIAAVPPLRSLPLRAETLAQLDSCDMDHATWRVLALRITALLARDDVAGVVVTHGTDTLEETAYFLQRSVAAAKPLVLTAAMRPASALSPDGPQNLYDAMTLALTPDVSGVLVALGGRVFGGAEVRKVHGLRLDAFDAGDAGALALFDNAPGARLRQLRSWPAPGGDAAAVLQQDAAGWPRVEIVTSHAGASGAAVDALAAAGVRGIVIAGTGNGSIHRDMLDAARRAQAAGVVVWRASRCLLGGVVGDGQLPSAGSLTPAQVRVALMLDLALASTARQPRRARRPKISRPAASSAEVDGSGTGVT